MSTHSKAAKQFLADEARERWHDQALWFVREKRDRMAHEVPEWEALRQYAGDTKAYTLTHLPEFLSKLEAQCLANGIHVHWAKDADEHNSIVLEILRKSDARNLVKSKSMLAEECGLNEYLAEHGIDVAESDLGERIMQFLQKPPSHIVLPAINVKRQEVSDIFTQRLGSEPGNSDPTYLTGEARKALRQNFLNADASMTGVNFAVAETGELVVCTNEGNADMGTSFAPVHIAIMGLEKVIPDRDALAAYLRLLARSATGQPITTYTSMYRKPLPGKEIHLVIVDNGRSKTLANTDHRQMLRCMRCGACMNTCPVYRRTGGYSYSYFIPGPLGINLGMLKSPRKYAGNVSACSLCYSCQCVCPVKIDLADQIYKWRQQLDGYGLADGAKKMMVKGMKFAMKRPRLFYDAVAAARIAEKMPRFVLYNPLNVWGKTRDLPDFPSKTFNNLWKSGEVSGEKRAGTPKITTEQKKDNEQ